MRLRVVPGFISPPPGFGGIFTEVLTQPVRK
ncbi:Uncharacterised protein [Shigella sonnei]|nr:Uncharacterised protein [Shigella sonnei]